MKNLLVCCALVPTALLLAETPPREAIYGGAVILGGQVMPLFDKGHLIYLHRPNRLQVFRPNTQLAYELDIPCPQASSSCSATGVALMREGMAAIGIGYSAPNGRSSGIRYLDPSGKEIRFVETGRYVPLQLTFDAKGNLWTLGWERDPLVNDKASSEPYNIVRKYSPEGKLLGTYLPTTLWPKSRPSVGGRGYWHMYAASDRIGAIINENFSGATPEWLEWGLDGAILSRTPVPAAESWSARAYNGSGRLYAQFPTKGPNPEAELKVLETETGKWMPARSNLNLPEGTKAFLLGADGVDLVFRVSRGGNVHLIWARPE